MAPTSLDKCGSYLSHSQYRVVSTLWSFANAKNEYVHPSEDRLASQCGLSVRQLRRILRDLEKKQILHIKRGWHRNANRYFFKPASAEMQKTIELIEAEVKKAKERSVEVKSADI